MQYHDRPSAEARKPPHFCSMCGPKFCKHESARKVRDFASKQNQSAEGFLASRNWQPKPQRRSKGGSGKKACREMAEGYKDKGDRLYLPEKMR